MTSDSQDPDYNPFAAPQSPPGPVAAGSRAEEIRNAHLSHEASVRAIGVLYIIAGILILLTPFILLGMPGGPGGPGRIEWGVIASMSFSLAVGMLLIATAYGLRKLHFWARFAAAALSVPGFVLGFPIGSVICLYILYLLFSRKGAMIFSAPYRDIMQQTPHIQYKTPVLVWVFLLLLIAVLGFTFLLFFDFQ